MRITLLGSKDFDSLEFHLNDSFIFLGHDVCHIDIHDIIPIPYKYNYHLCKFSRYYDEMLNRKLGKKVLESEPDLVVCTYRFIHPIAILIIKKVKPHISIIHINPDALTTFEYQQIFASPYDAYFTKDPFIVRFMKDKMDLNAFYLPEAFNPRVHQIPSLDRVEHENRTNIDVVAFGNMYPYRAKMIHQLIVAGIDITLFGNPDKRFGNKEIEKRFKNEFITGQRKSDILFGSKIVFNNFHYAEIESANVKYFEISGIGGFQICDYKPVLKEYSLIPVEQYTFKNINEAIELIKYYIDKPKERHELALKQHTHFLENHTYEHRIKTLFKLI